MGQKTQQVWTDANGDALTLNYTYDSSGNLTLETDSQGNTLSFVYNGEGLMTTEIATSSTGTVARTQWSYNAEQQITQIQDYTVASGGTAVLTINNSYDINGNLTTETETGSGVSVTYVNTYDADNRITSEVRNGVTVTYGYNAESEVTSAGSQTNSFDANGNLTNSGFSTGTYNEINTDGTWSYYYDGVGNMVEKINLSSSVTWNYAYDMDYQLTSAVETNAGGTVLASGSYSYDVFNNLVAETITVSGVATTSKFIYDGSQIYADLNSTGSVQTLYVTGMSNGSGQLYGRIQSGTLYWIVQDRQGSVREIINSSGSSILDAITYADDGGIQSQTGSTYLGNYGYTGLRYDSLTTYWVAVNRWYNPAIDQWLEIDPDGYAGGLSDLRDYVGNDWTNSTDLAGLSKVTGTVIKTQGCLTITEQGSKLVWYTPSRTDNLQLGYLNDDNEVKRTIPNGLTCYVPYDKVFEEADKWRGACNWSEWNTWFEQNSIRTIDNRPPEPDITSPIYHDQADLPRSGGTANMRVGAGLARIGAIGVVTTAAVSLASCVVPAAVGKILNKIPLGAKQCEKAASAIAAEFKAAGQEVQVVTVRDAAEGIYMRYNGVLFSETGKHTFAVVGTGESAMVYDGITGSAGMKWVDYMKLLADDVGIVVEVVK